MEIANPLHVKAMKLKYPSFPERLVPKLKIMGTSTNVLERRIVTFIQLHGWYASRVANKGTSKQERFTSASGYEVVKNQYIPSTSEPGIADVDASPNGKVVKIEVKNAATKDRMSPAQAAYKKKVEISGGIYYVATDIDSFIDWYYGIGFGLHPNWDEAVLLTYKFKKSK